MDEFQGVPRSSNSGGENIGLVEVLYKVDGGLVREQVWTLGILLCQCSGEHLIAGDRPPCWLSRQSWAPVLPKSVATQISRLREATLGAHWSTSARTLTRAA